MNDLESDCMEGVCRPPRRAYALWKRAASPRPRRSAVITVLAIAAFGCAGTTPNEELRRAAIEPHLEALFQLRSLGCPTGSCPIYSVTIYSDGEVDYVGSAHVAKPGRRRFHLQGGQLGTTVSAFESADFLDLPEHCCDCKSPTADRETTIVVDYRPGGVEKEISHADGCRSASPAIRSLEQEIERAAGAREWIKGAP